jgi:hypothetical protein
VAGKAAGALNAGQGQKKSEDFMSTTKPKSATSRHGLALPDTALALYDGRDYIGCITRRDQRFIAHDAAGAELGAYETLRGACWAIPAASDS